MPKIKMKPCPFCGSNKITIRTHMGYNRTVEVECKVCKMEYDEVCQEITLNEAKIEHHTERYNPTKSAFIAAWSKGNAVKHKLMEYYSRIIKHT